MSSTDNNVDCVAALKANIATRAQENMPIDKLATPVMGSELFWIPDVDDTRQHFLCRVQPSEIRSAHLP
jgi:hypothetical protein